MLKMKGENFLILNKIGFTGKNIKREEL